MRLSRSFDEFRVNLAAVRYKNGEVAYRARNHFFTDWSESSRVIDVTAEIGGAQTKRAVKTLNRKKGGGLYVPGIEERRREVAYIPSAEFGPDSAGRLSTGDYIGIYAEDDGLDVTHTGIVVLKRAEILFRHASQVEGRVIDCDLSAYMASRPGMVILRPR